MPPPRPFRCARTNLPKVPQPGHRLRRKAPPPRRRSVFSAVIMRGSRILAAPNTVHGVSFAPVRGPGRLDVGTWVFDVVGLDLEPPAPSRPPPPPPHRRGTDRAGRSAPRNAPAD